MYKRFSAVMFPIIALFFIGAIVWGYQEQQKKDITLIKAENQYQRAFHELTYHINKLRSELGQIGALNVKSQGMHRRRLFHIWGLSSQAQNEVNQLPLMRQLPFDKTKDLLSRICQFSYCAAVRDMTKQPLNKGEMKTLKMLRQNAEQISKDLQQMQYKVIKNNLRWADVETVAASKRGPNTIIDGFKTVDKRVGEYPGLNWGPSVTNLYKERSIKMLKGNALDGQQIKKKVEKFLGKKMNEPVRVRKNGKGTKYESYTVYTKYKGTSSDIFLDYTKQGFLMSYMNTRPVKEKKLSMLQAEQLAKRFLQKHDYLDMQPVRYDGYANIGVFSFVPVVKDVCIYPQQVTVRVALDNGEVMGLQAINYVCESKKRKIGKPKLTRQEAQAVLNPDMNVSYHRLVLIKNDFAEEVLCYEFGGTIDGDTYRIYVNADQGIEEKMEEIKPVSL